MMYININDCVYVYICEWGGREGAYICISYKRLNMARNMMKKNEWGMRERGKGGKKTP